MTFQTILTVIAKLIDPRYVELERRCVVLSLRVEDLRSKLIEERVMKREEETYKSGKQPGADYS